LRRRDDSGSGRARFARRRRCALWRECV
jgi:hypothetical protein